MCLSMKGTGHGVAAVITVGSDFTYAARDAQGRREWRCHDRDQRNAAATVCFKMAAKEA